MNRRARTLLAPLLFGSLVGCAGGHSAVQLRRLDAQSRLDIAAAAQAAGINGVATNMLADAAAAAPGNAKVQQRYIRFLSNAGRLTEARQALSKAAMRLPDDLALLYEAARLNILSGDSRLALTALDHILRVQPENAPAWCAKGVALDLTGDFGAAADAFTRAASLAPFNRIVANDRAVALMLRGQPYAARDLLRGAAGQNPTNDRITNNLALAEGLSGDPNRVADLVTSGADQKLVAEATHLIASQGAGGGTAASETVNPAVVR